MYLNVHLEFWLADIVAIYNMKFEKKRYKERKLGMSFINNKYIFL